MSIIAAVLSLLAAQSGLAQTGPQLSLVRSEQLQTGTISFNAASNVAYTVQSSTNLTDWSDVTETDKRIDGACSALIASPSTAEFYRLRTDGPISVLTVLDASSPPSSTITISKTSITRNIILGSYAIKSLNKNAMQHGITVLINMQNPHATINDLFSIVKIKAGSQTYSASYIENVTTGEAYSTWKVHFTNMALPLVANIFTSLILEADALPDTTGTLSGSLVWTEIVANGIDDTIDVEDQDNAMLPIVPANIVTSVLTLSSADARISNTSATIGGIATSQNGYATCQATFSLAVTAENEPIYISSNPTMFLGIAVSVGTTFSAASLSVDSGFAGDMNTGSPDGYFMIPPGMTRQFTMIGIMGNAGIIGSHTVMINGVSFGLSSTSLNSQTIGYGLDNLRIQASF